MCQYLLKNHPDNNYQFLFANTGKEKKETLDFVHNCDVEMGLNLSWIEYDPQDEYGKKNWFKLVDYETASRNGEPFAKFIKKERIPNSAYPNCSGRLKSLPMHNYIKYHLKWEDYYTCIGIRYDERKRVRNWVKANEKKYLYPLITDHRIDEMFVRNYWAKQDYDLNLKDYQGNCDFCYKKSFRKLLTLASEDPDGLDWWSEMEEKHGDGYTFFRDNISANEIRELSKNKRFEKVKDLHQQRNISNYLFDMDAEATCFCNLDEY